MSRRLSRRKPVSAIIEDLRQRNLMPIAQRLANDHHVLLEEMLGEDRSRPASRALHALWAELHAMGFWSFKRLGSLFNRHHTTIISGVRGYHKLKRADAPFPTAISA